MHPGADELRQYVDDSLPVAEHKALTEHVEKCEFCAEFCENYRQLTAPIDNSLEVEIPENLRKLADDSFMIALRSAVIPLRPLSAELAEREDQRFAADGNSNSEIEPDAVATLCSENPEIVLRVAHSQEKGRRYLQLMAEEDHLSAHVMVRVPELDKEFLTDANGRADIDLDPTDDIESLKWQIKLPEALFELQPLDYDPDKVEDFNEVILESDQNDRVIVRLERRTEGKVLSIRIEELSGRSDFGSVKVAITQDDKSSLLSAEKGKQVDFGKIDADSTINIRLYTD